MTNTLIFTLLSDETKNFVRGAGTGLIVLIVLSVIMLIIKFIGRVGGPHSTHEPTHKPDVSTAQKNTYTSRDASFTVIKKNKNHEYVLSHKVYGSPIYMRTDDVYDPGDTCTIDMGEYKVAEIEIQRSSKKITKEKWLLPK